jgi:transcription termination factor Rho
MGPRHKHDKWKKHHNKSRSRGRGGRGPQGNFQPGGFQHPQHQQHPQHPAAPARTQPAAGILEVVKDGRGFLRVREHDYSVREDDVVVPVNIVRRLQLLQGSFVEGIAVEGHGRKGGMTMQEVQRIDGHPVGAPELRNRIPFKDLTSLDPVEKFDIAKNTKDPTLRLLDLLTPIGRGQRGLIVAPPRTGKTILLQKLANAIIQHHPDVHVIALLVDERPEEATDWRRNVKGEVICSTNDEMASNHVGIAEIAIERAKRLVEMKRDVVILFDSLTRLARAYNIETKNSGRTLTGGIDARTMEKPKSFFGSARKVEEGGSLTIIATALVDTGSKMDQIIFEEFKGTGNMELVLSRKLADLRIFPAIDINLSGTRKEEKLLSPDSLRSAFALRRVLSKVDPVEGMQILIRKVAETESNEQFFSLFRTDY